MSIFSRFKKDRLFQHLNKFSTQVDNNYLESYYYLINNVEYNDKKEPVKVLITILLDVQQYLIDGKCLKIEKEVTENISDELKAHIKMYEALH